jgi:hypothetical protein
MKSTGWLWRGLQGPAAGEVRAAILLARKQGARVELSGRNHVRIVLPGGGRPVYAPLTSRSPRAAKRVISELRQAGLGPGVSS